MGKKYTFSGPSKEQVIRNSDNRHHKVTVAKEEKITVETIEKKDFNIPELSDKDMLKHIITLMLDKDFGTHKEVLQKNQYLRELCCKLKNIYD